jgi:predicted MFS family arabinose efflux permease
VACAIAVSVGSLAFAASRLSREWRPAEERHPDLWGALRGPGVRTLLVALTVFGAGVAGIEVAVAAFAGGHHGPNSIGVLLALWGVGSMAGGLVSGRFKPPADAPRRLAILFAVLALANLPLAAAGSVTAMGALLFVAGVFIAPALAAAFALLSDVAPAGTVTEAQTWVGTSFGFGVAAGSALAGWLVDGPGTFTTFLVVFGLLVLTAAVVAARLETLVPAAPRGPRQAVAAAAGAGAGARDGAGSSSTGIPFRTALPETASTSVSSASTLEFTPGWAPATESRTPSTS